MTDQHLCPICRTQQRCIMETWVCPLCDFETVQELEVALLWKEIYDIEHDMED